MSGGGSSKKKTDTTTEDKTLPAYMTSGTTVAPFMPGWDNSIAQQLAAGGYGSAPDLLTYMQQFYSPMQVPGPPPTTPPATTPTGSDNPSRGDYGDRGRVTQAYPGGKRFLVG